ncbi:HNH endonuclease [Azotobacter chroococcum]|uniref:HNH endonuclease n=1 Tax=Azotobacter chroococcum TaxID=353 RepID=UPI0013969404|nr:HNH endonuclease [Azotobacter chroococcum]
MKVPTRTPRRKSYSSKPSRLLRGWLSWLSYLEAFQAYTCEPNRDAPLSFVAGSLSEPHCSDEQEQFVYRRLYVLEPDDLCDFSTEDVVQAWQYRIHTCGSVEAAAELLALFRIVAGEDDFYTGAKRFLDHPDVLAIFAPSISIEPIPPSKPATGAGRPSPARFDSDPAPLSLAEVRKLSSAQLMRVWAGRPDSFASLEAAAEALASLRWLSSGDAEKTSFKQYLNHALIQDLEDFLPRELNTDSMAASAEREIELLKEDRREVKTQLTVVRTGQQNFRSLLFQRYGGACCVTGCSIERLVEAAHIIPYRGSQTDEQGNGVLLRVDIHRLFDEHLVSIDPEKWEFIVSKSIADPNYQALHGSRLFQLTLKPRRIYLEDHYRRFHQAEKQRNLSGR